MNTRNLLFFMSAAIAVIFLAYEAHAAQGVSVSHAWVQAMPPTQTTTAAYMTITNTSSKEVVLVSASSDIAGAVEIHRMSEANGMMTMAMVKQIAIPARSQVTLQPGGYHIMLINLKKPVHKGEMVPVTLHFKGGASIIVNAEVKMQGKQKPSSMPGMRMSQ
ncbi:MAG: copper chaperone PCu(A)C [Candidatus Omnitrophica bacterium]|nr:copper chaperone PCu(A)C [Candidatus Omnitrophota bacterium]MDE2008911.1 copper chaperone PCu(A)C [Candidatus Omnitrophota bacterium]MDE2213526.1 copper chaperone PCu(A)C [Candidatus Omnitrophota bacterium]MDE2230573.1 copper chaperone PCu(A)C [Candidatus Omnitrophota bacterium]